MSLLLDLTIRSSIVVLFALAASACLRKRSAALRHWVLATGVFVAAAIQAITFVVPAWDVALPMVTASTTATQTSSPAISTPAALHPNALENARRGLRRSAAPPTTATSQGVWDIKGRALGWVALVWATGVVAGAAMLLGGIVRLVWMAARATHLRDGPWPRLAEQVSAVYGLTRPVTLLQTNVPDMLATLGLFQPRVLLPAQAGEWSEERAHIVLWHELGHIRRRDWVVQISAEILRTIYWFNPLLWVMCAHLRRESEQACDDLVLDAGVPARDYATQLLALARTCRPSRPAWASGMPMAHPSTLERRITAMLNPGLNREALTRRAIIMTTVALLGIAVPIAAFRVAAQPTPTTLSGTVYDASGAVLPGVEVMLLDERQVKWQAVTDATGRFQFVPLGPGHYVIEASLGGFRPLRHEFDLRQARDWDRAITLQVGTLQETITVTGRRGSGPRPPAVTGNGTPLRVGGVIRQPSKLVDKRPVYPQAMQDAGVEGVVPMEAIIGRDGAVLSVRVISAQVHPALAMAAVDAVRQWKFNSTLLNGVAVEVVMTVSVRFGLTD